MKKKIKKAFTLVELLVVIAILAILATVSIVGYNSFTKKAKVSNDTVLVKQMNDILFANSQLDGNNNTMTEALEDVFDGGYDLNKLTPTTTNYNIVWDSVNDQMVLLDEEMNVVFPTSDNTCDKKNMFMIAKSGTSIGADFSYYLADDFTSDNGTLGITNGLDVGNNTSVKTITYTGTGNSIIYTNSYDTNITQSSGTILHYGNVNTINLSNNATYNEYGNARVAKVDAGSFNTKENANVTLVTAKSGTHVNIDNKSTVDVVAGKATVSGSATKKIDTEINDNTVAIVDNNAKDDLNNATLNGEIVLLKDVSKTITISGNTTIVGNMVSLTNATVTGSGNVSLKNINTNGINVDTTFTGTLSFDGGQLSGTSKNGSTEAVEAFKASSSNNPAASYSFKNMTITTSTEKGIKIQSAKSVIIDNCVFDCSSLKGNTGSDISQNRSLSAIDITYEWNNANSEKMDISITNCTFKNIPSGEFAKDTSGSVINDSDTAGAIKIKDQKEGYNIGKVEIKNNTFIDCYRDIVIGKANENTSNFHMYTFKKGTSQEWVISNNTSTNKVADKGVLTNKSTSPVEAKEIGVMYGGCAVYDIANAYTDANTYAVVKK